MNVVRELVSRLIFPRKFVTMESQIHNLKEGSLIFNTFSCREFRYRKLLRVQIIYRKNPDMTETEYSTAKDLEVQETIKAITVSHFKVDKDVNQEYRVKDNINLEIPNLYLPTDHEIRVIINKTPRDVYTKIWIVMEI